MQRDQFFGGNPVGVFIRLVLLSVVVGVVMSALGITPANVFYHLDVLVRRIYDMGFGSVEWLLQHFLIGAVIVFPIWLIARLIGVARRTDKGT
ncbi:MAG: integrase [Hyphomicrobiaceae bacterium]|nr:integrase [Hyphomicrobiaceae bacterium]